MFNQHQTAPEDERLSECLEQMTLKQEPPIKKGHRVEGICCYKCPTKHRYKECPIFSRFKKKCTTESYTSNGLKEEDKRGFCAAGIMLKSKDYFLFIKEKRKDSIKLNFPGGKRESFMENGSLRMESYLETASTEFVEEMSELVEDGENNQIIQKINEYILSNEYLKTFWSGPSKYALVIVETDDDIKGMLKTKKEPSDTEVIGFEWVHKDYISKEALHPFTYKFFEEIFKM